MSYPQLFPSAGRVSLISFCAALPQQRPMSGGLSKFAARALSFLAIQMPVWIPICRQDRHKGI
jgi:hypothetical protein